MYYSPLRYPGGKRRLANFVKLLFRSNDLLGGVYAEAYAGGAAVALELLFEEYAERVHINDLDDAVYSFWWAVLNKNEEFCQRIKNIPITLSEWEKQKSVLNSEEPSKLDLAVATFFLNRTNRSGIITGGVIGGKDQSGKWKMDARFNKENLLKRIRKIGRFSSRIELSNIDGLKFIKRKEEDVSLFYLDPPYYISGKQELYSNFYEEEDHKVVANKVKNIKNEWVVSYDNVEAIRNMYNGKQMISYGINYSAQNKYEGDEVIIFSDGLNIPSVENPSRINKDEFMSLEEDII